MYGVIGHPTCCKEKDCCLDNTKCTLAEVYTALDMSCTRTSALIMRSDGTIKNAAHHRGLAIHDEDCSSVKKEYEADPHDEKDVCKIMAKKGGGHIPPHMPGYLV